MNIHVPTLLYVISAVTLFVSVMMLREWLGGRRHAPELLWWSAGFLCISLAGVLATLRIFGLDFLAICISNAVLMTGHLAVRRGTRQFCGRPMSSAWFLAGPVWIAVYALTPALASTEVRVIVVSAVTAFVALSNSADLWGIRKVVPSAKEAAILYLVHGVFYAIRIPTVGAAGAIVDARTFNGLTFNLTIFEGVIFSVVIAYFLLSMARERDFVRVQALSETDYLTGIDNRRAFTTKAEAMLRAEVTGQGSAALLLFDLDHFKRVNDRHGHMLGDEVLKIFCRVVEEHLAQGDLFGRLGGEEFAALLPCEDALSAERRARAISEAFAARARMVDGREIGATVSIGLATTEDTFPETAALLIIADQALYRAKHLGRNRVERCDQRLVHAGSQILPAA